MIKSTMMDFSLTLPHLVERVGLLFPNVEVVSRMPDKQLHRTTYGQVQQRTKQLASALTKCGVQQGEAVATLMWNHSFHLEAYLGIPIMGGVLHTLNLRLSADDIAYIANHADDQILIVDDVLLPLYEQFKDKVSFKKVIVVPLTGDIVADEHIDYEDFISTGDSDFDYPANGEAICHRGGHRVKNG